MLKKMKVGGTEIHDRPSAWDTNCVSQALNETPMLLKY